MKAMDPIMLSQAIHQVLTRGRQTTLSYRPDVTAVEMARYVVALKKRVPRNWIAAASHARSCGDQADGPPHVVEAGPGGRHGGALTLHQLAERGGGEEE